ncbi:hypothetical protein BaRGS_00035184, partial [Batillaria attramentaria]
IGYYTALDFAARNARVILACRSKDRGQEARDKIVAATRNENVMMRVLDLSSLSSVREFASAIKEEEDHLDILVNNAGVFEDGLELNMATNHFGPFLLTQLLLDLLKMSAPSRIVNVSSGANQFIRDADLVFDNLRAERQVSSFTKYSITKLANILFTQELERRLKGTGVSVFSLHPGDVKTEIGRNLHWALKLLLLPIIPFMRTPEIGAQTSIHCAVTEGIEKLSGKYFIDCCPAEHKVSPLAKNEELAKNLWNVSLALTGLS